MQRYIGSHPGRGTQSRPDPDLLARFRGQGRSAQDIADQLGLERSTVYRWFARYGIARRPAALRLADYADAHSADSGWTPTSRLQQHWRRTGSIQ